VVAMPLVGTIDSWRAQMIMEALLEGISNLQAEVAILDITGVRVVDTQVASALLRAAQAAQLLGARVMLTGIGAEVAQSLVHLGADLSRIEIQSTLQAGVAAAIQQATN
jgi:rsbT co-antagonist protein RsbR